MAAVNHITAQQAPVTETAKGLFASLKDKLARRRIYRETMSELSELSNAELADLGLHRSMIKRLALQAAYDNA